jgi:hypothetical protein
MSDSAESETRATQPTLNPYALGGVEEADGERVVTKENAPSILPQQSPVVSEFYWVILESKAAGQAHYPDPDGNQENPEPLCESRGDSTNWKAKTAKQLPTTWIDLCDKCKAWANGKDYMQHRGGGN